MEAMVISPAELSLRRVRSGRALMVAAMFVTAVGRPAAGQAAGSYTQADVHFMQGMMAHHAQAVAMAGMAATHGASSKVQLLSEKITLSQRDEMNMMRQWLGYRKEVVPDSTGRMPSMPGMADMPGMTMTMPGMLTPSQMAQLDRSHGAAFDSLFLTGMIQHHRGALKMVADLIATPPAGQDSEIFRFITDVDSDQRAEIGVMQQMLYDLPGSSTP
jgi:uncharacterized protein (DUF305 family)